MQQNSLSRSPFLEEYVRVEGHAQVPKLYRTDSGIQLGWWVRTQRMRAESLSAEQKKKLESLEKWKWSLRLGHTTKSPGWESRFQELQAYAQTYGHVAVPASFRTASGFALQSWMTDQKKRYRTGKLEPERVRKLESVAGWEWGTRRVGISDLHFHDLRREFACRLLESKADLHDVREFLGHANVTTTSRYLRSTPVRLVAALQRMTASAPPSEAATDELARTMPIVAAPTR